MKVEYLVVTQQEGCFCNNEQAFNNLLQADTQITINKKNLTFLKNSKKLEVEYSLETGEIKDKKQRYFHIKLIAKDENEIEIFTNLVRTIRKIVEKLNSNISINTLWDDISIYYIIQAYPLINEVENVMRKLILKFMLVNVGRDWVNEAITSDLRKKIETKAELNNSNNFLDDILHNADFIHLSSVLFEKKRNKDLSQFDNFLLKKDSPEIITFEELKKDFLLISNWDRYFSSLIKYEGNLLENDWKELYVYRNKIAHNRNFSKDDLKKVEKLRNKIVERLDEAIKKLDKVQLNEEQKRNIIVHYHEPSIFLGRAVEDAIYNWYAKSSIVKEIEWINSSKSDQAIDFSVVIAEEKNIGVLIKLVEPYKLNLIKKTPRSYAIKHVNPNFYEVFDEFHIILVVLDTPIYDSPSISSFDLNQILSISNSKIKLFAGWIDLNSSFYISEIIKLSEVF